MENRSSWIGIALIASILVIVALVYCFGVGSSGSLPENKPALSFEPKDKVDVLKTLLIQNREEIRFYQDKVFTVSFSFAAALLGIVAFALKTTTPSSVLRQIMALSCLVSCCFYLLLVRYVHAAILENDKDLISIQYALRLSDLSAYLTNSRIYEEHGPILATHTHIFLLATINGALTVAAFCILICEDRIKGDAV